MAQCKCGAPLVLTQVPLLLGQSREVRVRLERLPCQACPEGHVRRLPDKAFGANILTVLYGRVLPVVETRGVFRKTYRCPRCLQMPDLVGRQVGEVLAQVDLPGYPVFVLKVTAPLVVCRGCGLRLVTGNPVLGDTVAQINTAISNAFEGNGVAVV